MHARRGIAVGASSIIAAFAILGASAYLLVNSVPPLVSYFIKAISGVTEKPVSEPFTQSQTATTSLEPEQFAPENLVRPVTVAPLPSIDELRQYALKLINADRAAAGLTPVIISDNRAAQAQADDIAGTGQLSHWMTDGEKPYMSYSRYGGTGYVAQNAAICCYAQLGNGSNGSGVLSGHFASAADIEQAIKIEQDGMINNDMQCCDNGHRINILDSHHTGVSIGIAYNNNSVVMVQNFENNYLALNSTVLSSDDKVVIAGSYLKAGYNIEGITITYDKPLSHATYLENLNEHSYGSGSLVATVRAPAPARYHYEANSGYQVIEAGTWQDTGVGFDVQFDLSKAMAGKGQGVYTVTLFLATKGGQDAFPAFTYSVFASGQG